MSLLGAVAWLTQTRMDIAIYTQALQRVAHRPLGEHMQRLNKVVKWVKRKPLSIVYRRIEGPVKLIGISDSAFRKEDKTGLAMRGCIIALAADDINTPGGPIAILDFAARRQRRVCRSTFSAELNAIVDAAETGRVIQYAVAELMLPQPVTHQQLRALEESGDLRPPLDLATDCKSVYTATAAADAQIPSESSLVLVLLALREMLMKGLIRRLWWCPTGELLSDGLTKGAVARAALMLASLRSHWPTTAACVFVQRRTTPPPPPP